MTDYSNKMVNEADELTKGPEKWDNGGWLMCVRECELPGVGAFKAGQKVQDLKTIKLIGDNPNFKKGKEE